jgi:hypothetical protein
MAASAVAIVCVSVIVMMLTEKEAHRAAYMRQVRRLSPQLYRAPIRGDNPAWSPEPIKAWKVNTGPVDGAARCLYTLPQDRCSRSPGLACRSGQGDGCGWYAYKNLHDAAAIAASYDGYAAAVAASFGYVVVGVFPVLLSGRVIEYERGYRAEFCEVVT